MYYKWSKFFLEASKNGLTRAVIRDAASEEVRELKEENADPKKAVIGKLLSPAVKRKTAIQRTILNQKYVLAEQEIPVIKKPGLFREKNRFNFLSRIPLNQKRPQAGSNSPR